MSGSVPPVSLQDSRGETGLLGYPAVTSIPPPVGGQEPALQGPYAAPYSHVPPPPRGTNGFAIAALVLGILPVCLGIPGLIFGIVALAQTRKTGQKGKGLAIAGLSILAVWLVVGVSLVVFSIVNEADRDDSGAITGPGDVSVTSLQVGDCVEKLDDGVAIYDVPAVPCSQPHQAEVVGEYTVKGSVYPGEKAIEDEAFTKCSEMVDSYGGEAAADVSEIFFLYPRQSNWNQGDHKVTCLAYHDPPRTGSLKG